MKGSISPFCRDDAPNKAAFKVKEPSCKTVPAAQFVLIHEPRANPREVLVLVLVLVGCWLVLPRERLEGGLDRGLGQDRSRGRGQVFRWAGPGVPLYWTGVPVGGGTYCSQGQGCGMTVCLRGVWMA